jgi:mannose-6-phosphate isomerase-like protein (cupin superfamily)
MDGNFARARVTRLHSGRVSARIPYGGRMHMESLPLSRTAAELPEFWSQRIVGEANGSLYKVAKGVGATTWHAHDDQDEVFIVTEGELIVELRDGEVRVAAGELFIVPRGVEHRPRADRETHLLLVGTSVTSTAAGGKPAWSQDGGTPAA